MTKIIGLHGKFNGNLFDFFLKSLENKDNNINSNQNISKGIFLSSEDITIFNNKFCNIDLPETKDNFYNIGLISLDSNTNCFQPIKYKEFILIFNGVIYNTEEINSKLLNTNDLEEDYSVFLIKLLYKFYKETKNLKEATEKTNNLLNGDYVFAIFDANNLAISRDSIGIKPLYYNKSISKNFRVFASEKKYLWKMGINNKDIDTLKPGHILYNWEKVSPKSNPWDLALSSFDTNASYDEIKSNLLKLIENSIYNRIKGLNNIGLLFSAGVDSTIIATLLKKYQENNEINITLYTVGVKDSKDLKYSKKIAKKLNLPIKTMIINEEIVRNNLNNIVEIIEEANLMKIGVGMTLYLATKLAAKDNISVVISGQGADELFAGYHRYQNKLNEKGPVELQKDLCSDIENSYKVNLERDTKVAEANGVQIRIPFFDEKLVNYSLNIPIKYKIKLQNNTNNNTNNNINNNNINNNNIENNEDNLRKRILRDLAIDIGVPEEIAFRPKKAAQYGSGIDKILRKKILKTTGIESILIDIIDKYSNN